MFLGVLQSFKDNKVRLAIVAGLALLLLLAAAFSDRLLNGAGGPEDTLTELKATQVARTPISDSDAGRMAKKILEGEDFQKELPEKPELEKNTLSSPMSEWAVKLIVYFLAALGVFAVVVFIWILVVGAKSGTHASKPKKNIKWRGRAQKPVEHHMLVPAATMADVEKMAQEGRYGEAVRMLLSIALIKLSGQDMVRILPSMTGREIVASAQIGGTAIVGLRQLVMTVEAYAFAGELVDKDLFEACLKEFKLLNSLKGISQ